MDNANIIGNKNGIYLEYSSNNTIIENTILNNIENGINIDCLSYYPCNRSSDNIVTNNTICENGIGLRINSSSKTYVDSNLFLNNSKNYPG